MSGNRLENHFMNLISLELFFLNDKLRNYIVI
jgi:hypothetical protein